MKATTNQQCLATQRLPQSQHEINQALMDLKIKPTCQRNAIASVMFSRAQHLSADQVLCLVNKKGVKASRATVYNTLNLFVKHGLIRQVVIDPSKVFYDSNTAFHYHFYNEDSGELSDFMAGDNHFQLTAALPKNTHKSGLDIIVRVKNLTDKT